jgi:hypothetical protein
MVITADRMMQSPACVVVIASVRVTVRGLKPTGDTRCVMQSFLPPSRQAPKLKTPARMDWKTRRGKNCS